MAARTSKAIVEDFISQKTVAVVGVSRNPRKFGTAAYRELKTKGYQVFAVNPKIDKVDGDTCYPDLQSLPEKVEAVVVVVPPKETEQVVRQASEAGIKRVWLQQGAESPAALQFCREHDMAAVHGECILMFASPVHSIHKFHRGINRFFGRLPK